MKILFLISFTFSISLFSQSKTGIGNVSDYTDILIPNAIVQITPSSDTTMVYEYVCDKNGNYSFDITSNDSIYILNILPSVQTLQFTHYEENILLSDGNNEILFHTVQLTGNNGINFTITDTAGNPIHGAKVILYDTKSKWKIDSCSIAKAVYTNANGQIEINSLLPIKYWFNVREGYMTNRFTLDSTVTVIDTASVTNIAIVIRDLTQKEFYMCGLCDNKTWITDSMIIFGITQPYEADTKLLSDATWWDSNGRLGYWWFNNDETIMTYNYTDNSGAGGSVVEATNLIITDSTWVGDMEMSGLPVKYFMSVPYLDTIVLNLSVQDTTIYLNDNGTANIATDDLFINSNYCFTCNTTLSKYNFDINDIGNNEMYITIEDRCGNFAIDTFLITVAEAPVSAINEMVKSNINIYPNPSSGIFNVVMFDNNISNINVYDLLGQNIVSLKTTTNNTTINLTGYKKGVYIIEIRTLDKIFTNKVVIE